MLGEPVFRLSEGTDVPSMVVQLSNQEAVLPLNPSAGNSGSSRTAPTATCSN